MLGLGSGLAIGSPLPFSPKDIFGMSLWLKNGVGVTASQWDDSSGNNNHVTQGTSGNQAAVSGGGLDFEQSEEDHYDFTSDINILLNTGYSCFLVCEFESYDSSQNCFLSSSSSKFLEFQTNDKVRFNYTNTVTTIFFTTSNHFNVASGKMLVSVTRSDSGAHKVFKNGTSLEIDTGSTQNLTNAGAAALDTLGMREKGTPDRHFDGKIYELLFYSGEMEAADVVRVNTYLTGKHGL